MTLHTLRCCAKPAFGVEPSAFAVGGNSAPFGRSQSEARGSGEDFGELSRAAPPEPWRVQGGIACSAASTHRSPTGRMPMLLC